MLKEASLGLMNAHAAIVLLHTLTKEDEIHVFFYFESAESRESKYNLRTD